MTQQWSRSGGEVTSSESSVRSKETTFARLPRNIIESGLDDGCVRLFAHVISAEGPGGGWPVTGATDIGDLLSWQESKVLRHAQHLKDAGLLDYSRQGRGKYIFKVLHHPLSGRESQAAVIPPSTPRARKQSKYATTSHEDGPVNVPRPSWVGNDEYRGSGADSRPTTIMGLSKSALKYEERSENEYNKKRPHHQTDRVMCGAPGCDEALVGHTMHDHEPVPFLSVPHHRYSASTDSPHGAPGPSDVDYMPDDADWFIFDLAEDDPRLFGARFPDEPLVTDDDIDRWEAEEYVA